MKAVGLNVRVTVFLPNDYSMNEAKHLAAERLKDALLHGCAPTTHNTAFDVLEILDAYNRPLAPTRVGTQILDEIAEGR